MKQLLLWAGVLVLALQPATAQMCNMKGKEKGKKGGSVSEQIEKLSDEGREAALKGDAAFLETNTTDDYSTVAGMGNVMSKSDAIQMRKSGDVKYSSIDVSDKMVRVYGNSAVLTATADLKGRKVPNNLCAADESCRALTFPEATAAADLLREFDRDHRPGCSAILPA
jgi:uncharacterized protein DUF4440